MKIIPIILSGGAGTRLWPLSRALYPKQMMALAGSETMLQATVKRGQELTGEPATIICNQDHRFVVAEQMRAANLDVGAILLEPMGRNTAPAIAVAALYAQKNDPEAAILVMPSDHVIQDMATLNKAVTAALPAARSGHMVTFGITPDRPETGYGYISQGRELEEAPGVYRVDRFVEKPNPKIAARYVAEQTYSWNSGMFLLPIASFLDELAHLAPQVLAAAKKTVASLTEDLDFIRLPKAEFESSPSISIDYAVMEKTSKAAVVPTDPGWSDVGSWDALWALAEKDEAGNAVIGDVIPLDVQGSYLRSEGPLLGVIGVEDLIIVATSDAIAVAPRSRAQDIKSLVEEMKAEKREEIDQHVRVHRPWGWYQSTDQDDGFQVKRLCVLPGKRLSLQKHTHRAEHWVVVSGTARVVNGDQTLTLEKNQSTYIPAGTLHRLENPSNAPLHLIEVQSGRYLGEDDIERFDDDFKRHRT